MLDCAMGTSIIVMMAKLGSFIVDLVWSASNHTLDLYVFLAEYFHCNVHIGTVALGRL